MEIETINPVFIFSKDKEVKVLNLEEAKLQETGLKENGWKHTGTIEPTLYIQALLNDFAKGRSLDYLNDFI